MTESVFGREERRCQIIESVGYQNAKIRILCHGPPQHLAGIDVLILLLFIAPWPNLISEDLVGEIGFPFQISANVVIKCSGERALDARVAGVILGTLANRIGIGAFQAGVEAADGPG